MLGEALGIFEREVEGVIFVLAVALALCVEVVESLVSESAEIADFLQAFEMLGIGSGGTIGATVQFTKVGIIYGHVELDDAQATANRAGLVFLVGVIAHNLEVGVMLGVYVR